MFVDWAAQTVEIHNVQDGSVSAGHLFVAVLDASNKTHAEAFENEQLAAWIAAHCHAYAFFGGVARITVPDHLKTGVIRPCRYEPLLHHSYQEMTEAQLGQWKLLGAFQRRPPPQLGRRRKTLTEEDPRRTLFARQYVSLLLFGWLNPVLKTTRALCAASHFERMQAESQGPPVSLASFSAMQQVVEPELLAGVLREMSAEAGPGFGDDRVRQPVQELIANDGTLLPALPRMAWARWQNPQNRPCKLHLEFSVWRQVPVEFTVTDANPSERAVWQSKLRQGACYVNDRNYSHDYKLIGDVQKAKARFVLRWHNNALFTPLESAWGLSEADRQAGVGEDIKVRLGSDPDGPEGRLGRVAADGHTFLLFTNLQDLTAEWVTLIYRYRSEERRVGK